MNLNLVDIKFASYTTFMESFQDRINQLINDMIKSEISPEKIMWFLSSTATKKCDIYYRLDHKLPTSRDAEPTDRSDGDCIHDPSTTLEDLNREIGIYKSHNTTDCNCYLATNDCPVCQEGMVEFKLECCDTWYHQKCLIKWYYENDKCPTCRHIIIMEGGMIISKPPESLEVLFIEPYPVQEGGASPEVVRGGLSERCCDACGVQGHMAFNCPTFFCCIICGDQDHISINCPEDCCIICGDQDHIAINCPEDCCIICGAQGHIAINCPTEGIVTLQGTERVPTLRLQGTERVPTLRLDERDPPNPNNNSETRTVWGRDDDGNPITRGFHAVAPISQTSQLSRSSLEEPSPSEENTSADNTINVVPVEGHPNTFIDINHRFVLHQHADGSLLVSHVSNGPGLYDIRSLTDDEVRTAQGLGLTVRLSAPIISPSNNNADNSPRVIEPENNIPRIEQPLPMIPPSNNNASPRVIEPEYYT